MALPASFKQAGFVTPAEVTRVRKIMIGCDGPADSGKSEFAMSAPGPGMFICLDRGIDGVLNNPLPPAARSLNFGFKVVPVPKATQMNQAGYLEYWKTFYGTYLSALDNKDCRTVVIDGDTDSWELQRLAEFGRLSKVPSNLYDNVNAARRAMYARAYDSGKIVIATNRVRKEYVTKMKADGVTPEMTDAGKEVRIWSGNYEHQGFADQDYLWTVWTRHYYNEERGLWGLTITKCKPNRSVIGMQLEGDDCNFAGLIQTVYPDVSLKEWGL